MNSNDTMLSQFITCDKLIGEGIYEWIAKAFNKN